MITLLPVWSSSPLDQFTIRNLFSLKADLLGNFQISLINLSLCLVIITIIVFMFYILKPHHWIFINPPKPHSFIEREVKSSMVYGVVTLAIVTIITSHLSSLNNSWFTLDMLYQTSGLATTVLINHTESIIRAIIDINTQLPIDLNNGLSFMTLTQIHTNLTSYIIYVQNVAHLLQHVISNSGGSVDLIPLQELLTRLWDTSRFLLFLYRSVESALGITLANSPISAQMLGF